MLIRWNQYLSASPETPSQVLSQFLWYKNDIKVDDSVMQFEKLSNKNIKFFSQWTQLKHAQFLQNGKD